MEPGFYWVRFQKGVSIFVAEYTGEDWYVFGINYAYRTEDFIILSDRLQPPSKEQQQ